MPLSPAPGGSAVSSGSVSLESGPLCWTRLSLAAASTAVYSGGVSHSLPESSRPRLAIVLADQTGVSAADAAGCVRSTWLSSHVCLS